MINQLHLRQALPADADMLYRWQGQAHLREVLGDDDWHWHEELAKHPSWREQLIAELDGKPIGYVEIIDPALEESHYWGDCEANLRALDIWIAVPELLSQGWGSKMMQLALQRCFAEAEVKGVLLDPLASNSKAHQFYEKLGFKFLHERIFDGDVCYVYYLDRKNWIGVIKESK